MSDRARLVSLTTAVALIFGVVAALTLTGTLGVSDVRVWVQDEVRDPLRDLGIIGPLVFVLVGTIGTVALLPGPITCVVAGVVFGTAVGIPTAVATIVSGATVAFMVSRWWAHDAVGRMGGERVAKLRAWVAQLGFSAVLVARVAPGIPYSLVNYAAGLASIRLSTFVAATALGSTPRTVAYVALGGSFGDLRSPVALAAVAVLVAMAVFGAALLARDVRQPAAPRGM